MKTLLFFLLFPLMLSAQPLKIDTGAKLHPPMTLGEYAKNNKALIWPIRDGYTSGKIMTYRDGEEHWVPSTLYFNNTHIRKLPVISVPDESVIFKPDSSVWYSTDKGEFRVYYKTKHGFKKLNFKSWQGYTETTR